MPERPVQPTIQTDDLCHLKFLQDGRLSPDGTMVVYAVSHIDKTPGEGEAPAEEKEYVTLWLLSLETGQARQLTAGLGRDINPRWSPDGQQIAFLSTRGDKPQIYVIPVDGGEARALTAMAQGVGGGPIWSPDGTTIAFTAGPAAEPAKPNQPYRVTRHIYRFDGLGYLDQVVQDLYIIPAAGGPAKQLTQDGCHNNLQQWSPDGQQILFTATMVPDSHLASLSRLRVVDLNGLVDELVGDWGEALSAVWLPDGQRIAFIGGPYDRPVGFRRDLWLIDRKGGLPECRTETLKTGVCGRFQSDMPALWDHVAMPRILLNEDGATAYVGVQDGGIMQTYEITLVGPVAWTPVITKERVAYLLDGNDQHLLLAVSTFNNPTDLFIADLDGHNERQLTQLNAAFLAQKALPAIEHLVFPSVDGQQVEGWIFKPAVGQAPYPTILYIHGGPHSGFGHIFSFDFQLLAGAGYAVLFINQRGSTGYGDEFANISGDWGNLDYQDLMAGVDFAIERGLADPDRLGCCGLSGGGYLSCWIVGQTDRFKAAVPENPVTNFVSFYGTSDIGPRFAVQELGGRPHEISEIYQRCSPITYAHRCRTPTLLIQGEADYRCPAEQAEQFYTVLKANNCIVEMVRLPASAHAGSIYGAPLLRRAQNEALLDWMKRYVGDGEIGD